MSTELIPIGNNAEIVNKRAYGQHSDNTRPVSFLSEVEVNAMAAAAKTMRDGERNELIYCYLSMCFEEFRDIADNKTTPAGC